VTPAGRRLGRPLLAVAFAAALAGCSSSTTPAPSLQPIVAGPTPTVTTYQIATGAWIEGFKIVVTSATASLDAKGGTLAVQLSIENAGEDDATLDVPIVVTAGDAIFQLAHGTDLPDLAGGAISYLTLPFNVVGRGNVDDAVISIGRDGDHIVTIPLRPTPTGTVSLEPIDKTLKGSGTAGSLKVVVRQLEIRWDLPDWHDELPFDTEAMTVTYDATYIGSFAGGFAFTGDNVGLRLPTGAVLAPRQDGHSQSVALIAAGKTVRGLSSRFEIPNGTTGKLMLLLHDGSASGSIPIVIGP